MQNSASEFLKPRLIDVQPVSPTQARVAMEPFERGYAHTLGNALRRILLSSMPGFAPTEVSIAGVLQAFVEHFPPSGRALVRPICALSCVAAVTHRLNVVYRVRTAFCYRQNVVFRQVKMRGSALDTGVSADVFHSLPLPRSVSSLATSFCQASRSFLSVCLTVRIGCVAPLLGGVFFRNFGSPLGTCYPRVVVAPVVDLVRAGLAVEEAHGAERTDKSTFFASPIHRNLDVLAVEAGEVAVRAIGGRPQEQAHQLPGRAVTEAADQLLRLRVAGERDGYAGVDHGYRIPQQASHNRHAHSGSTVTRTRTASRGCSAR